MKLYRWMLLVSICFGFLTACADTTELGAPSLQSFEQPKTYNNHAMDIVHKMK